MFRALRASPVVLALASLAPAARAELPPPPDDGAILSFSISAYFTAPARCLGSFASHGVLCTEASGAEVFPAFARRLTVTRFRELGGFDLPRNDLRLDLGALALQLAAGLGLRWVVAGVLPGRLPTTTTTTTRAEGSHGVSLRPVFATASGGASVAVLGTF